MKRILIYKHVVKNGEYDVFHPVDYAKLADTMREDYHGNCPNWGNRVWLHGILSEIYDPENEYVLLTEDMTFDYINHSFDLIILPMANIFWVGFIKYIVPMAEAFEQIRVPTYVIACGVQADSYDDLQTVTEQLYEPAARFIRAIYQTGGEFALRGYFTKEFFDRLWFHTAVVTGCPSIYQCGRELKVADRHTDRENFRPILNGRMEGASGFLSSYPHSCFVDQDDYFDLIYLSDVWGDGDRETIKRLVLRYGYDAVLYASQGRMRLFPEIQRWRSFLQAEAFDFSFGSRIHGNIMSILSGIPAVVWTCDSRTREMTEYFDIPHVTEVPQDLYECYCETDYSAFSRTYPARFDAFEAFLREHDIADHINRENIFFYGDYAIADENPERGGIWRGYLQVLLIICSRLSGSCGGKRNTMISGIV